MKRFKALTVAAPLALLASLPALAQQAPAPAETATPAAAPATGELGLPEVDDSVNPCTNFYQYVCGPWKKHNPIPADQARWGSFNQLNEKNQIILRTALEQAGAQPAPATQRIGDFYAACMDEAAADAKGVQPLQPTLDRIKALTDLKQLPALLAALHADGVDAFFGFGAQPDLKNVTINIAGLDQGGIGLPDRDFYFRPGAKFDDIRAAYMAHIAHVFQLLGDDEAAAGAKARTVMTVETALAKASLPLADRNDPQKIYHKKPTADLARLAPAFDWAAYFKASGAPAFTSLNIGVPDFMAAVGTLLKTTSLDDVKTYLVWQTAHAASPWLSKPFVDERFAFYGKTLHGTDQLTPRWKRCVAATDTALGEDLGQSFVKTAFGTEQKAKTLAMVKTIEAAFSVEIDQLPWMTPATRKKAHEKLEAITNKIGYPDKWRDYSSLTIKRDDLLGNVAAASRFETARQLAKIGQPHDRSEWLMSPPTVNAYYDPTQNDINFPAGILQPPFYFAGADDAINYGAIGAVIGHEMTHGFDDQGRQFDKDGNLKDWWSKADAKKFEERAQCVVDEYNGFVAIDDVHLNGKASLGENLADNGGHAIAFNALLKSLADKTTTAAPGRFTPAQKFFLGYGQVWCSNERDEEKRTRAMTDVHALPEYRVNGVVSNNPEFAKAFNCKPDDAMVRGAKACKVW